MKEKDIKNFELGEHCFGPILKINGVDYDNLKKEEIIELLTDIFENNINAGNIIRECLTISLEHLQFDHVENDGYICEQCGNYNSYSKYIR